MGGNTHELVLRFLSALPLGQRPRVVTTDGEFHTIRRQLDRLAEEGLDVVKVSATPADAIADRLVAATDDRTAAVLVSSVLFRNAQIVPGLDRVAERCGIVGAELLVDAYHEANVMPMSIPGTGLGDAFVVGGGYKYCQLGEGNCFLRVPPGCRLRPAITGWFA
ncbi:MAG: kynureninase, partial [Gemmatimonadetes bacterium]|nr:kynureninase [Gemmatimonadota bacterium]